MESVVPVPRIRILTEDAAEKAEYELGGGRITIGRSAENNIVLQDSLVSRHHAELEFDGQSVHLRDVGGKNPIRVNGSEVQDYRLLHGDRITIGHTELLFDHPPSVSKSPLRVVKDRQGVFEPGLGGISLDAATVVFGKPDLSSTPAAAKSYTRLARLYEVSKEVLELQDEEQLFNLALSSATQETGAERGFIGLAIEGQETDLGALDVARFWDPVNKGEAQTLEMSETILNHIQRGRKAVLVRDVPDRHDFGASVIDLKIRSFICVPITHGERFLGLLYVDTRGAREQFDRNDLEFVSAVGRMAGLGLENLRIQRKLLRENEKLRTLVGGVGELIGSSDSMKAVFRLIEKVAPRDASVLIVGENGTGKELIARAIHKSSPRKDLPFVAVNCGAIPPNLVESELFGYEKGAFTGAQQTTEGKFDLAHGGTLFLDEIGDMPLDMQVKILRALQERKFYRVGGKKEVSVDIRVISATNRDLKKSITEGGFREDLYFRLAVVTIEVPPLRERGDDLIEIAESFLNQGSPVELANSVRECLMNYHWPGNIRELRNVLEQAVILGDGKKISPSDLPPHIRKMGQGRMVFRLKPLSEVEKQYILRVLAETEGNKAKAAGILGISRETLYQKLKQYGQDSPEK
jgi:DNA-binding NtrC family response regulator/pSer/pThr/pTyr-binding forkhead associated (FHA) protein